MDNMTLLYMFALATFLGFSLISKIPPTLHTPLMSGSNAISGITILGALFLIGDSTWLSLIAGVALGFAAINIFGGYLVTHRMLSMFKKKA
jgi:H+-translocating NAD(P) transhydrogenase subunit alpha